MDTRRLRYFAAVVDHGGFAQAAAALHVTQPALSTAVRKLEEELGCVLLQRGARPVVPTEFGRATYRSWVMHMAEQERLMRELRSMADLNAAHVSLVLGATFPLRPVVAALEALRARFPGFRLDVAMGTYSGNLGSVVDGAVDMILSQLPAKGPDPRFRHEMLLRDRFRAVCRPGHPLAGRARVEWEELAGYCWAGGGPFDAFLPGWIDRWRAHGVEPPQLVLHTNTTLVTMTALLEHDYLAMLPVGCIARELADGKLQVVPVEGLEWPQEKGASWLQARDLSPGAAAYLAELRRQLAREAMDFGATLASATTA